MYSRAFKDILIPNSFILSKQLQKTNQKIEEKNQLEGLELCCQYGDH